MVAVAIPTKTVPAVAVLGGVAAAAWVVLAAGIGGHTSHDDVLGHGHPPHPAEVGALIVGWLLMVAAMMLPPEIGSAVRNRSFRIGATTATAVVAVTAATWTVFAIIVLSGDSVLHALADSRPWLAYLVTPTVLIGVGLYQLTPIKRRLLDTTRCSPTLSWRHTLSCLGSCGALMLVMFAFGVGSLLWMGVLTAVMVAERSVRTALVPTLTRVVGVLLIMAGLYAAAVPGSITG
jgi:predicted metal-binding membrane protein